MCAAILPVLGEIASIARRHAERYGVEHVREVLWRAWNLQAMPLLAELDTALPLQTASARARNATDLFQHRVSDL
jgi:hypothetical protein